MANKDIERMRELVAQKKSKGSGQSGNVKPEKKIGEYRKGVKVGKRGGLFDK